MKDINNKRSKYQITIDSCNRDTLIQHSDMFNTNYHNSNNRSSIRYNHKGSNFLKEISDTFTSNKLLAYTSSQLSDNHLLYQEWPNNLKLDTSNHAFVNHLIDLIMDDPLVGA